VSDNDELTKATTAYNTAIELWKLASQEIYSRFAAMLTGNSIIMAIIGLAVTGKVDIEFTLLILLTVAGWVLCIIWGFFVYQGLIVQQHYRERAEYFEQYAIPKGESIVIKRCIKKYRGFWLRAYSTIGLFAIIYLVLMIILLAR
jgi:hypothetical protein